MNSRLPNEITLSMLSYLDLASLARYARVSKMAKVESSDLTFWANKIKRDFYYVPMKQDELTKENYKNLTVGGIYKERERYFKYMLVLQLASSDCHSKEQYQQKMDEIDKLINASETEFENYYSTATKNFSKEEFDKQEIVIKGMYQEILSVTPEMKPVIKLLIAKLLDETKSTVPSIEMDNEQSSFADILYFNLLALFKLNATTSLGILLQNAPELAQLPLFMLACQYPNENVVKKLLHTNADINQKSWAIDELLRMHVTPIAFCLMNANEQNAEKFKPIVSLLLEHGADTDITFFASDDDWNSHQEFLDRHVTFEFALQYLLNRTNASNEDQPHYRELLAMFQTHLAEKNSMKMRM